MHPRRRGGVGVTAVPKVRPGRRRRAEARLSVRAENASLVYQDHGRDVYACREIDLEVQPGEFLGILGPSGSGKSSLLYLLSGLKLSTLGKVTYEGKDLASMGDEGRANLRLREFGFVFQQPYLLGYLSAVENVLVTQGDPAEANDLLDRLGVLPKAHRLPHELSGGERQRVCVARALLARPKVIFADEPTAALDHTNGVAVVSLLNQHRGTGSLVMVTHDPTMLEEADRIVRIVDGQIVQ
ncbi:ATP-binding cassette domain-containing protein [bacterium]|nr:MAG: ATP-binding cassette domain-containing protein [bacterium]